MVYVKEIINKSRAVVEIIVEDGSTIFLPPRCSEKDLKIENYYSIKNQVKVIGLSLVEKERPIERKPRRRRRKSTV